MFCGRPVEVAHRGMGIDDETFDAMVDHLICALCDLGLDPGTAAQVAPELEHLREKIVDPG